MLQDLNQLFSSSSEPCISGYGAPESLGHLLTLPFIGFDKETLLIEGLTQLGFKVKTSDFKLRSDSLITQLMLARAGAGYCIIQTALAKKAPDLVCVLDSIRLPDLPFWLVCHADIQYSKKIRTLMSFLGDWFTEDPYQGVIILNKPILDSKEDDSGHDGSQPPPPGVVEQYNKIILGYHDSIETSRSTNLWVLGMVFMKIVTLPIRMK